MCPGLVALILEEVDKLALDGGSFGRYLLPQYLVIVKYQKTYLQKKLSCIRIDIHSLYLYNNQNLTQVSQVLVE